MRVCNLQLLVLGSVLLAGSTLSAGDKASPIPKPALDTATVDKATQQTAVLAGGCFWGMQEVFEHVRGVSKVVSGYSGGEGKTAQYKVVSTGDTGHAESVKITYDPSKISYGQLLRVFFSVAHDPTELNRQGPDEGTQYRSVIFYESPEQQRVAEAYIAQLGQAKVFPKPIVTQVVPFKAFYAAESYHQDYAKRHPDDPYISFNDAPKVDDLREQLPDLYVK